MNTEIRYLKGVGDKRAALYQKLRIETIGQLLRHLPREYIDLSAPCTIAEAPADKPCAVRARLISKGREQRVRAGLSIFKLTAADDSGEMQLTIFNSKYTVAALNLDQEYIFYGICGGTLLRRCMQSPAIYPAGETPAMLAVYAQTKGLPSSVIRRNVAQALELLPELPDPLSAPVRDRYQFPALGDALRTVHFPADRAQAARARSRFVFEELLVLSLAMSMLRAERDVHRIEPLARVNLDPFYNALPFQPTGAQLRCIGECVADLCGETPMNRLIQGDVGSGKTLVVAACVYFVRQNAMQSVVMAPTEILAEQHFATLRGILEPLGVRVALLTGATKPAARRDILKALENGDVDLCIGTHALLSEGVRFRALCLAVTDEQHRFGVRQRAKLSQKSEGCHVMVLSATPIPRTLSLIIYGDLSLSVIDELPPGRQPVDTYVVSGGKRARALNYIKKALDAGRQAYIVCPLIEQNEADTGLIPAARYAERLAAAEFRGYSVALLHGRMKPADKEQTMRRMRSGEVQLLVSTTVVEVGVDVPNATIILIENAERFGLSQLHQLRGRVGRGAGRSTCILISDARNGRTRERLNVMKATNDGFAIAEHDLKLRGPGDFFGHRQHGLPELRVADLADDLAVLQAAQDCALSILAGDPALTAPENALLAEAARRMILTVGERPN